MFPYTKTKGRSYANGIDSTADCDGRREWWLCDPKTSVLCRVLSPGIVAKIPVPDLSRGAADLTQELMKRWFCTAGGTCVDAYVLSVSKSVWSCVDAYYRLGHVFMRMTLSEQDFEVQHWIFNTTL